MAASPRGHSRFRRLILTVAIYLFLGAIINIGIAWALATDPGPYVLVENFVHTGQPIFWSRDPENDTVWGGVAHTQPGRAAVEVFHRLPLTHFTENLGWEGDGPKSTFEIMHRNGVPRLPTWSWTHIEPSFIQPAVVVRGAQFSHLSDRAFGWPLLALTSHWRTFGPKPDNTNRYQREVISGLGVGVESPYNAPTGAFPGSYYVVQRGATTMPFFYLPPRDPIILPLRPIWTGFLLNTLLYAFLAWIMTIGPFQIRRAIRTKRGRCPTCGYNLRGAFDDGCSECGWNRELPGAERTEASRQQGIEVETESP